MDCVSGHNSNFMPSFGEVVETLKAKGLRLIRKRRFRLLGPDMIPDYCLAKSQDLDAPEPGEPDFWVPEYWDGYGWKVALCVPPWMVGDESAAEWYRIWRAGFLWPEHGEVSDDPEDHVRHTLSSLRDMSNLIAQVSSKLNQNDPGHYDLVKSEEAFAIAKTHLENAMVAAYKLDGSFPPRELEGLGERELLRLSDQIAEIMELAFRAGKLEERGAIFYRLIPSICRRGKKHVDAQKSSDGARLKWTKATEEILRDQPSIKTRALAEILRAKEVIFTTDGWGSVDFEDGTASKSWDAFDRAVSRIRTRLNKK